MSPDTLHRALSYPYKIPTNSYIVHGGEHQELAPCAPMPDVSGRRPVLAVGSNQSPEQLIRKFNGSDLGPIPVIRARLKDFDIVYSPHVASYGSIPATLRHSPGTRVTLFVDWLTPEQESHMHETEIPMGNYHFGELDGIELQLDFGPAMTSAYVYLSRRGSLTRDGFPVALAAVRAENRIWASLSQEEIQNHARDITAAGQTLEAFIRAGIEDVSARQERTRALMSDGLPFNYSGFTPIEI